MKGVADQFLAYLVIAQKKKKKEKNKLKKVFFYLMNCILFNSFIIYQHLKADSNPRKFKFYDLLLKNFNNKKLDTR